MGKYISCGKFNKNYCFIISFNLLNSLFYIVLFFIIAAISSPNQNQKGLLGNKGIFINPFLKYIGQSLCIIPELFVKKILNNEKEKNTKDAQNLYKKKKIIHELIFNDLSDRLTLKDKINIFIISLLLLTSLN